MSKLKFQHKQKNAYENIIQSKKREKLKVNNKSCACRVGFFSLGIFTVNHITESGVV